MQTDTHTYDGKIPILLSELAEISKLSLAEKKEKIAPLCNVELPAKHFLTTMIADLGTPRNFDPTNRLNADDLLVLAARFLTNEDFLQELNVQLADMATGFCPQGRTHRLYQLLFAFLDPRKMNDLSLAEIKCQGKVYESVDAAVAIPYTPEVKILVPSSFPGSWIAEGPATFQHLDALISAGTGTSITEVSSDESDLGASVMITGQQHQRFPCASHLRVTYSISDFAIFQKETLRVLSLEIQLDEDDIQQLVDLLGELFLDKVSLPVTDRIDLTPLKDIKEVTLALTQVEQSFYPALFECDLLDFQESLHFASAVVETPVKRLRCHRDALVEYPPLHVGHSVVMGYPQSLAATGENFLYSYEGPVFYFFNSCTSSSACHLRLSGPWSGFDLDLLASLPEVSIFTVDHWSPPLENLLREDLYELGVAELTLSSLRGYPYPTILRIRYFTSDLEVPPVHSLEIGEIEKDPLDWDQISHVLRLRVPNLPEEIPWQLDYLGVSSIEDESRISQLPVACFEVAKSRNEDEERF